MSRRVRVLSSAMACVVVLCLVLCLVISNEVAAEEVERARCVAHSLQRIDTLLTWAAREPETLDVADPSYRQIFKAVAAATKARSVDEMAMSTLLSSLCPRASEEEPQPQMEGNEKESRGSTERSSTEDSVMSALERCRKEREALVSTLRSALLAPFVPVQAGGAAGGAAEGGDVDVVVVGGGPVGLIHGLLGALSGANVVIVERRREYVRDVWFDLTSVTDGFPTKEIMVALGMEQAGLQIKRDRSSPSVSVRCQELERFLMHRALLLGAEVWRGWQAGNFTTCPKGSLRVMSSGGARAGGVGNDYECLAFDVLVVADGGKSTMRKSLDISFSPSRITTIPSPGRALDFLSEAETARFVARHGGDFDISQQPNGIELTSKQAAGVHQVTMIARFKRQNGDCPMRRPGLRPFDVGFFFENVTSVFPRFYYEQCEMQILLTNDAGEALLAAAQAVDGATDPGGEGRQEQAALVLDFLRSIANLLLLPDACRSTPRQCDEDFAPTIGALADLLLDGEDRDREPEDESAEPFCTVRAARGKGTCDDPLLEVLREKAINVFKVQIEAVDEPVFYMDQAQSRVVVVAGDASVTAHYRLGVGVNNGFNSAVELYSLLESRGPGPAFPTIATVASTARRRVRELVQLELFSIVFEAYCGMIVQDQRIFWRRGGAADRRIERFPRAAYALSECFVPKARL